MAFCPGMDQQKFSRTGELSKKMANMKYKHKKIRTVIVRIFRIASVDPSEDLFKFPDAGYVVD